MKNAVQYSITTNVSGNAAERPPSQTPGAFPVFHGADILRPAEDLRKIAQGGKSQKLRDMGLDVNPSVYTVQQAKEALLAKKGGL